MPYEAAIDELIAAADLGLEREDISINEASKVITVRLPVGAPYFEWETLATVAVNKAMPPALKHLEVDIEPK